MALFVIMPAFSDGNVGPETNGNGSGNETTLIRDVSSRGTGRPKMPSIQVITCVYTGSSIYLTFILPEGKCTLSAQDSDGHSEMIEFDSDELSVTIPFVEMHGDISITLQTEQGNTYVGIISSTDE